MSILNGLRKAFTATPPTPAIPSGTPSPQQEIEFLKAYNGFAVEIANYKMTVNRDNVPSYYKELRFEQYESFKKEVAGFVRTITGNDKFMHKVLDVDGSIALYLLDRKDCLKHILKTKPMVIKILPETHQEDPELAEVFLEHNVGKVKHLPLKFRNAPDFMYRCLADESKFKDVGPVVAKTSPTEIINAIGTELKSKLTSTDYQKVLSQLKPMVEAETQAKILGEQFGKGKKEDLRQSRLAL